MTNKTASVTDSAETGALVIDGAQPAWMTLNDARERAFTGEIVFESAPEVFAYLDNGVVYFAERASDDPLGQRLLDAGLVDATQLERGMVRIGDLEHLGRLFSREPSIDRDAVLVMAELSTESLIEELANETIASVRATAYRHHPSGVHRWFVAPVEPAMTVRPIDVIGQLEGTTLEDLPGLPYGLDDDELMIEWGVVADDDTDLLDADDLDDLDRDAVADAMAAVDAAVLDDIEADAESTVTDTVAAPDEVADLVDAEPAFDPDSVVISFDLADPTDLADLTDGDDDAGSSALMLTEADDVVAFESDAFDQSDVDVLDGSDVDTVDDHTDAVETVAVEMVDVAVDPDLDVAVESDLDVAFESDLMPSDGAEIDETSMERSEPASADEPAETDDQPDDFEFAVVWPDGLAQPAEMGSVESGEAPDSEPVFTETDEGELHFSMPPLVISNDSTPADDDVPDDVAAAVRRAIAAIESASVGDADGSWDATPEMTDADLADSDAVALTGAHEGDASVEPASMGFAPPTMAMRAEVLYGEVSADGSSATAAADSGSADDDSNDRESALRRLIGGLRRKDH